MPPISLYCTRLIAFVIDGGDESQLWENEFLKDNTVGVHYSDICHAPELMLQR